MTEQGVSRRVFLKLLGGAFALSGLGAGLGGLATACNSGRVATNTTATIRPGRTTSSTLATTTATSGPEQGRPVRVGLVSAKTGALALFGKADDWWADYGLKALPQGIVSGDGKARTISVIARDNRSDPGAAGKMAVELITDARVDILLCSGAADLVNAVATEAEARSCPCLADFVPWRSFVYDRGGALDRPFKWTYALAFGLEDLVSDFLEMWGQLTTNKSIGLVFPDNLLGRHWTDAGSGLPHLATVAKYACVLPPPYVPGALDFGPQLADLKKNGCEICCGAMSPADFMAFWEQARAHAYQPKVVTVADGLVFPQALEAVGASGRNLTSGGLWQRDWPFKDSITGRSPEELAQDYMSRTNEEWTPAIGQYAKFEWVVDVFKRVADILDKDDIIARVRATRLETCMGLIDFTAPLGSRDVAVGSSHPMENVYKPPVCGVQWVQGSTFMFEPKTVANVSNPELPVSGTMEPIAY